MKTIPQLFDLTGRSAIVTGGAIGIGQAIALRLGEAGAAVMIADIDLATAIGTAQQITARGGKANACRANVRSLADVRHMVERTLEGFGSVDILVNNAGIYPPMSALDLSEDLWDSVLDVNLKGAFICSQAAAREMIKGERAGKIINIASIDALHPSGQMAHYNASKGGLVMLTKALALEFAPYRITVNALAPGGVDTPGTRSMPDDRTSSGTDAEQFLQRVPLGRIGEPDDIAKAALFFSSAAADYVTGSLLVVDGGFLLS